MDAKGRTQGRREGKGARKEVTSRRMVGDLVPIFWG